MSRARGMMGAGEHDSRARFTTVDSRPFFLPAGPTGCLLLHGLTATPYEMRFLGERLHAAGYTVSGVQLAGHGTSPADLERCRWRDWYASASDALRTLQSQTATVVVTGQSMGALLALLLAADHPDAVRGVALLSPALVLSRRWLPWVAPALPLLVGVLGSRLRFIEKGDSDIADPAERAASPSYRQLPTRTVHQLTALQAHVRRRLRQVRQPTLIVHSRSDHTCPIDNVRLLQSGLGGPVETLLLERSYHVVSVDVDREQVAAAVARFTSHVCAAAPQLQQAATAR